MVIQVPINEAVAIKIIDTIVFITAIVNASQCLKSIWTMASTTEFNLVSPEVVKQ